MKKPIKNISQAKEFLNQIPFFGTQGAAAAKFGLERIRDFMDQAGNPQKKYAVLHVAGTNGKGSVCHLAASVLQEAGYRVGLYTSPHLIHFRERFRVNGQPVDDALIVKWFDQRFWDAREAGLSFFEITTAAAFELFYCSEVDIAVIETGLGGRLDATNIVQPAATAITTIGLDHTDILGSEISAIAREKAGIIKDGIPVVLGNISGEADHEIRKIAAERKAPVVSISAFEPEHYGEVTRLMHPAFGELNLELDLKGEIQSLNAATAAALIELIAGTFPVKRDHLISGLSHTARNTGLHGRFERLHPGLDWYFDGAHNEDAVSALMHQVGRISSGRKKTLVLSMMSDKIKPEIASKFSQFDEIWYFEGSSVRGASLEAIQKLIPGAEKLTIAENGTPEILDALKSELVIFSGSFYFYSHIKQWISTVVQGSGTIFSGNH